ncbi:hypothetical protein GEMRC1_010547 [Eukaryota sp. GEM-RC1]
MILSQYVPFYLDTTTVDQQALDHFINVTVLLKENFELRKIIEKFQTNPTYFRSIQTTLLSAGIQTDDVEPIEPPITESKSEPINSEDQFQNESLTLPIPTSISDDVVEISYPNSSRSINQSRDDHVIKPVEELTPKDPTTSSITSDGIYDELFQLQKENLVLSLSLANLKNTIAQSSLPKSTSNQETNTVFVPLKNQDVETDYVETRTRSTVTSVVATAHQSVQSDDVTVERRGSALMSPINRSVSSINVQKTPKSSKSSKNVFSSKSSKNVFSSKLSKTPLMSRSNTSDYAKLSHEELLVRLAISEQQVVTLQEFISSELEHYEVEMSRLRSEVSDGDNDVEFC